MATVCVRLILFLTKQLACRGRLSVRTAGERIQALVAELPMVQFELLRRGLSSCSVGFVHPIGRPERDRNHSSAAANQLCNA